MKHLHSILMAVVVLLVSSCATKSDIEDLQSQLNELKTGKIASIEQQITSIQASITSLQATDTQLSAFVSTLQLETSNIKADLSAKEKALSDRIDELKKYTDDELGKTKDWVSATFATLEQYQAVLNDLAEIKESIKALDKDLRKEIEDSIKASEESMKGWVNEQLAGYYTIAQMDAKLKALADADAANEQAIAKVADNLKSAKTELTEAYTKAITDAITKYNGDISAKIAADIKAATDILQKQIDSLDERVAALEGMIQSVTIIPEYSDGSVKANGSILSLSIIVSPASSVSNFTKDNFTILITTVQTKGSVYQTIPVCSVNINRTSGLVDLTADISSVLPVEKGKGLAVSVNINGNNSVFSSPFVGLGTIDVQEILSKTSYARSNNLIQVEYRHLSTDNAIFRFYGSKGYEYTYKQFDSLIITDDITGENATFYITTDWLDIRNYCVASGLYDTSGTVMNEAYACKLKDVLNMLEERHLYDTGKIREYYNGEKDLFLYYTPSGYQIQPYSFAYITAMKGIVFPSSLSDYNVSRLDYCRTLGSSSTAHMKNLSYIVCCSAGICFNIVPMFETQIKME